MFGILPLRFLRPALGILGLAAVCAAPVRAQDLYVANKGSNTVEKITPGGTASVFASGLAGPTGLAFDSAGDLFVANNGAAGTIIKYAFDGTTLSSTGTTYFTQAGAAFQDLTFDSAGNLYAASSATNSILKITAPNTATTFYSGSALNAPYSLVFDSSGTLYVGNIGSSNSIVKITGGTASTFSTGTVVAYGLAFDSAGALYATNAGAANVLKYAGGSSTATAFVPTTSNGITLSNPHGTAFDSSGNLYLANTGGSTVAILKVTPSGTVSTFDTTGLNSPVGLAFSPTPAPEPSPRTALATGAIGLGGMALVARKRTVAK